MISFMLAHGLLSAVLASAVVGFIVCLILHSFWPCKQYCEKNLECEKKAKECCDDHGMIAHIFCKIAKFAVLFVQAYGLAFVLDRLNVLSSYADALAVAIFLALTFIISHMFLAVVKHKRSCIWFVAKAVHVILVASAMAAVLVYMVSK